MGPQGFDSFSCVRDSLGGAQGCHTPPSNADLREKIKKPNMNTGARLQPSRGHENSPQVCEGGEIPSDACRLPAWGDKYQSHSNKNLHQVLFHKANYPVNKAPRSPWAKQLCPPLGPRDAASGRRSTQGCGVGFLSQIHQGQGSVPPILVSPRADQLEGAPFPSVPCPWGPRAPLQSPVRL